MLACIGPLAPRLGSALVFCPLRRENRARRPATAEHSMKLRARPASLSRSAGSAGEAPSTAGDVSATSQPGTSSAGTLTATRCRAGAKKIRLDKAGVSEAGRGTAVTAAATIAVEATAASPDSASKQFFLVKSEPDDFSVDRLEKEGPSCWEGVRNYQARNIMMSMNAGDQVFFYHSSCKVPAIVGIAEVIAEPYPDNTAFDPDSKYFDSKSSKDTPRWFMVDMKLVRKTKRPITLEELKQHKDGGLSEMALLRRARLSVQSVSQKEWEFILGLETQ
mmetsp:Transcript_22265/g.61769  ORF Transcript_22265/g.61769 Transcript_22265/m.61769 type:complete len:277 (-) Transcript_22265:122-952(-)